MPVVPIIGALLMIALTNVIAGMLPGTVTGDAQLAIWLVSLLVGVFTFTALQQALR